jgi:hypothetical protein
VTKGEKNMNAPSIHHLILARKMKKYVEIKDNLEELHKSIIHHINIDMLNNLTKFSHRRRACTQSVEIHYRDNYVI